MGIMTDYESEVYGFWKKFQFENKFESLKLFNLAFENISKEETEKLNEEFDIIKNDFPKWFSKKDYILISDQFSRELLKIQEELYKNRED
jgi:hypothetical protein